MFGGRKTYRKGRKACRKSRRGGKVMLPGTQPVFNPHHYALHGGKKSHHRSRRGGIAYLNPNGTISYGSRYDA